MAAAHATIPLLHRFLGIGLVMLAATFLVLRYLALGPISHGGSATQLIAYTLSGIGVVLGVVALVVMKPRVPERAGGQSAEQFWTTPAVATKVLPVWFLLEGAGTIPAIGYYLSGEAVCLLVSALGITAFWLCGPNTFAKA